MTSGRNVTVTDGVVVRVTEYPLRVLVTESPNTGAAGRAFGTSGAGFVEPIQLRQVWVSPVVSG